MTCDLYSMDNNGIMAGSETEAEAPLLIEVGGENEEMMDIDTNASPEPEPEITYDHARNRKFCRLIKVQMPSFYDNIFVPYHYFRDGRWDIRQIIYENTDALFYSEKYMSSSDQTKFEKLHLDYFNVIAEIMDPEGKLYRFLDKWTIQRGPFAKWRDSREGSHLKNLILKHDRISPFYFIDLYADAIKQNIEGTIEARKENIIAIMSKKIEVRVKNIRRHTIIFKKRYDALVSSFVFNYPIDFGHDAREREHGACDDISFADKIAKYEFNFVSKLLKSILNFADKLMSLDVYAVHAVITEIIDNFFDIDNCILHHKKKDKERIIIV